MLTPHVHVQARIKSTVSAPRRRQRQQPAAVLALVAGAAARPSADEDDQDWLDFLATGLRDELHAANNRAGLPWLREPVLLSY